VNITQQEMEQGQEERWTVQTITDFTGLFRAKGFQEVADNLERLAYKVCALPIPGDNAVKDSAQEH
jgi:hypothetical protein